MNKNFILALLGAVAMASTYNAGGAQAADMCTKEHCQQLMSVRAYNKSFCKTQAECLTWLAKNNICSNEQLARCKKRDVEGVEVVPDLRSDGMDY